MASPEPQTTKFTEGQWIMRPAACRDHPTAADVYTDSGKFVANCGCHEEAAANARAIACLPELYAALKAITSRFESERDIALGNGYPEDYAAIETAKALLAKVEGR